ncbi:ankyrin-2-like [Rhagoletis pomonella]|uniref:ankyrin-2-like n=1 Tax=Rhagoletis pomonella TaxID=28610 RepID=UPI0017857E5A|nr:ankyrin-2-like [Rhagoletis pomonella]
MDCRNISEATKMATELYKEVIHVPFMAKFVVFAKKVEPYEARLRVFCMTDDREDKTLEKQERFTEVAKSRDVEVLEGKPQFIEMAGNLVPVTKSGDQLQLQFKAFRENRLPFTVRVKDQHADIVGRTLFMKEPKVAKGEPPQHPICILNIVLPDIVIPDTTTEFSDKITTTYRSSLFSLSKHQNDHYIGDIRIVDLSNLLGKDWIQLASEIGISTEEIDEIINQNTDSIARQAQSMIRLFKDKPNYDIHALEVALKNIGRDDIMKKCKSGRLSHSRDFDETDIMKNSESVEELVRQESKRIQQIHDHEEVKYSAEEKEVEESESDEEITKRTVAERREKIVKRLSIERQIPASSQKKEITREISEIKRKSLIEDKKAIHESEINMQLPTDNIVKSTVAPDQVMKMKMGKMDTGEISKSDFDKELTHKLKTSGRSSEEEDSTTEYKQIQDDENLKIVQDISAVEKPKHLQESPITSEQEKAKQMTEDFLNVEKQTQLPADITISEKFVEEVKEKELKVAETVEKSSQKIEKIITAFEGGKYEDELQKLPPTESKTSIVNQEKGSTIEDKIADFEARGVTYDMISVLPKDIKKHGEMPTDDVYQAGEEPTKSFEKSITEDFLSMEQKSQLPIATEITKKAITVDEPLQETTRPVAEKRTSLAERVPEPRARLSTEVQAEPESAEGKKTPAEPIHKVTEITKEFEKVIEKGGETVTTVTTATKKLTHEFLSMEQKAQTEAKKTVSELATSTAEVRETAEELFETTTELEVSAKDVEIAKMQMKEVTKDLAADLKETKKGLEVDSKTELRTGVLESAREFESATKTEVLKTIKDLKQTEDKVESKIVSDVSETTKDLKEAAKTVEVAKKTATETLKETTEVTKQEIDTQIEKTKKVLSSVVDVTKETTGLSKAAADEVKIDKTAKEEKTTIETILSTQQAQKSSETLPAVETKKLTADFLTMEQQMQLPTSKEPAEEDQKHELLKSATHTVIPSVLGATVVPGLSSGLEVRQQPATAPVLADTETTEVKSAMSDLIKTTSVIMATVPKLGTEEAVRSLEESLKDIKMDVKALREEPAKTDTKSDTTLIDFEPDIVVDEKTTTLKMSSAVTDTVKEESIKLVESIKKLEEAIKVVDKSKEDGIEVAAPINEADKVTAVGVRKLTEDFLTIEQTTQFTTSTKPTKETIVTDAYGKTTTLPAREDTQPVAQIVSSTGLSEEINKIVTEAATKIDTIKLTDDFLAAEQRTQLPVDQQQATQATIAHKTTDELAAPAPVQPRKSITLTDAEFCKSVEETITKKMSAGQIEIGDELKTKASDIPDSQTPPPTPIEIRTDRQDTVETSPRKTSDEKSHLTDTVITLHKTTESTFERVSGISKIALYQVKKN